MIDPSAHPDPPVGLPDPPKDWFEFWVRFACGALFGLVIGGWLWLRGFWRLELGWLAMPAAGLACASATARCGDNFWFGFLAGFAGGPEGRPNIYGECRLATNPVRAFR